MAFLIKSLIDGLAAVMVVGRCRGRTRAPAVSLSDQVLPRVKTYTLLGVSSRENLSGKGHIAHRTSPVLDQVCKPPTFIGLFSQNP